MGLTLTRRPVDVRQDYAALLEMHRLSWRVNFPGERFDEWVFRATLETGARQGDVFAYEYEGRLVAWLWMSWPARARGHVRHIQVAQDCWGRGIGRAVMEDAVALCLERGCDTLTLVVTKSNERAMALYAHLGFTLEYDEGARQRMRLDLRAHAARQAQAPEER